MRPRPARLDRLPPQYFTALLSRVCGGCRSRRRAARRSRTRESGGRPSTPRHRAARGGREGAALARLSALRRPPGAQGGDRRPLSRPVRRRARPRDRGRDPARHEDGARRAGDRARRARQPCAAPGSRLPGLSVGCGARGGATRLAEARPGARLGSRLGGRAARRCGRRVPELPVEPLRRGGARRRVRRGRALRWRDRRRDRPRLRLRRPRLRRPARRRASSPRLARRTTASRCSRCRRPTGWPAGGSASSSGTPRSSSG